MIYHPLNSDWTGKEAWEGVHVDLNALREIVGQVLRVPTAFCGPPVAIQDHDFGSCGRIYSFQLPTRAVVARLVAPVKPLFKTEGEIAAMDFVRRHTTLPVPEVFSYCSEADNPVGAEWIIMEHVSGKEMSDVWDNLSLTQKQRLGRDIVDLHAQLSKLKADGCGGIYHNVQSVDDFNLSRTPRWRPLSQRSLKLLRESHSLKDGYKPSPVPSPAQTLPVYSAEEYANLVANNGNPSTRSYYELFVRAKCVELLHRVTQLYPQSPVFGPTADSSGYCFTHGDLHEGNIFVDPETGALTGIVDWESAAFRPMWMEVCGVGWFNEDRERFIFGDERPNRF
ncbi:hypothetical protein D9619_008052 [Psilocybe cf. subviscida]|uniref:Aminoglycoside phosphotransferase domain-containing protein n=1 Tax=Psilocybe cf. subviscida TaxID=2480587 RepID=A0A8H5AUF6_9AGAR|nr:hypothetical protein D9619_008052 [Psilocybe cf. subviscida]